MSKDYHTDFSCISYLSNLSKTGIKNAIRLKMGQTIFRNKSEWGGKASGQWKLKHINEKKNEENTNK